MYFLIGAAIVYFVVVWGIKMARTKLLFRSLNRGGEIGTVNFFLSKGIFINGRDEKGLTPLMKAAGEGASVDVINALLKAGADVNLQEPQNNATALMLAAGWNPSLAVVKALVAAGADLNAETKDGMTALNLAAKFNSSNKAIIDFLFEVSL